jgi:hypothetical protein
MTVITDGWFELELDQGGYLAALTLPWMKRGGEKRIELKESFGFFFLDGITYISPHTALKENLQSIQDIMRRSPNVRRRFEESGERDDPTLRLLEFPKQTPDAKSSSLSFDITGLNIRRTIRAHPSHPIPEIVHTVRNDSDQPRQVSYYWCLNTDGNQYCVYFEKGDLEVAILPALGYQASIYILRSPGLTNSNSAWGYINLNFGTVLPGEAYEFRVKLWSLQHPWIGSQFSGIAYALSPDDHTYVIAAMAATTGRNADAACWILDRLYSPIFVVSGSAICDATNTILRLAPIRKLMTNIVLDKHSISVCNAIGVDVIYLPSVHNDPYVAVQRAMDEALGYNGGLINIVNILPENPETQILLTYYFSLRREVPASVGHVTAPARNLFALADTVTRGEYIWSPNDLFVRILGTDQHITENIVKRLPTNLKHFRHEYGVDDSSFNRLVTYFAYHDYTLARMAFESSYGPTPDATSEFIDRMEKETGERIFWGAPIELVAQHGKPDLYGPPFSVMVSIGTGAGSSILNSVIGAQYSKSLLACLHPVRAAGKEQLRNRKQGLSEIVNASRDRANPDYRLQLNKIVQEFAKDVQEGLSEQLFELSRLILEVEPEPKALHRGFGRMCVYMFVDDLEAPLEVTSKLEFTFASLFRTAASAIPCGRMFFCDPLETGNNAASTVLANHDVGAAENVLMATDPTGDLRAGILEEAMVISQMHESGVRPVVLIPPMRRLLTEGEKLFHLSVPLGHPYLIGEVDVNPEECSVANFSRLVATSTGLHYTGHGFVDKGKPTLVLSDGDLPFERFPQLARSPWIFLNACELGHLGSYGNGSARFLLLRGARNVMAPFLSLDDFEGLNYSVFYNGIYPLVPPALCFHHSRSDHVLLSGSVAADDAAYVVYGDPYSPQGGEVWEFHEALMFEHWRDIEWRRWSESTLDMCRRVDGLWKIVTAGLSNPLLRPDSAHRQKLLQAATVRQRSNHGLYERVLADVASSGAERSAHLESSAEWYSEAAVGALSDHTINLLSGYSLHMSGICLMEGAVMRFLVGAKDFAMLRQELTKAVEALRLAVRSFNACGASGDERVCADLRERIATILSEDDARIKNANFGAFLHRGKPLRAA